ncbi:MAG: hypothetical protein ACJARY_001026 [Candidatus Azotimanducaceae bacterium]|jgi:hypothetical protein
MSKSYEVQGIVHSIGDTAEFGQNGFTKREFVVKLTGEDENPRYPNYVALELTKDKCAMMDNYAVGDEIQAHFNLSGRLWSGNGQNEKCFTSLQAWRISTPSGSSAGSQDSSQDNSQDNSQDYSQKESGPYDDMSSPLSAPPPAPPNDDDYDDIPF